MKVFETLTAIEKQDIVYLFAMLVEATKALFETEDALDSYEIEVDDEMYEEHLNEMYEDAIVCGHAYAAGYALKIIDSDSFNQGRNNYSDSLDKDEDEGYQALEEIKEGQEEYIYDVNKAISESPFGIAAQYNESPLDFFESHIISSNTLNPIDVIPAMYSILRNTVEYAQLMVNGAMLHDLDELLDDEHADLHLPEVANELIDLCNQYSPSDHYFGYEGSDLGYHYTGRAGTSVNHPVIYEAVDYKSESMSYEDAFLLNASINEDRYVMLPQKIYTGRAGWITVDTERELILDVYHSKSASNLAQSKFTNEEYQVCGLYGYDYSHITDNTTTLKFKGIEHRVVNRLTGEVVYASREPLHVGRDLCIIVAMRFNQELIELQGNYVSFKVRRKDVVAMPETGVADEYVERMLLDDFTRRQVESIAFEAVVKELEQTGAWTDEELQVKEDSFARLLWIMTLNFKEDNDKY